MKPFTALMVFLVLLAGVLAGYAAFRTAIARKSGVVVSLTNQIQALTNDATRVAAARSALAELSGDEAALRAYFVSQTGVVGFIDDLQSRGRALGTVVEITSVAAPNGKQHPTILLSIGIRGSFDAVLRTLGSIEYAPYDISITNLSLNLDTKGAWVATANLSVGSVPLTPS